MNNEENKITVVTETGSSSSKSNFNEEEQSHPQEKRDWASIQDDVWAELWPYEYCSLRRLEASPNVRCIPRLGETICDPQSDIPTVIMGGEIYAYMPKVVDLLHATLFPEERANSSEKAE